MTCFAPRCILFNSEFKVEVTFRSYPAEFKVDNLLLTRLNINIDCAVTKYTLIRALTPIKFILAKVCKHKLVFNFNNATLCVNRIKINILIEFFNLAKLWCNTSVAKEQTVAAEVTVVWIFTKITAVSKIFNSVFILGKNTLVNPVPNKTALKARIFVPKFCIFIS